MDKVEKLISAIRASNPDAVTLYTKGQCYNFSLILRVVFEGHELWYDRVVGHIYSKIGKYWYDIRGKHYRIPKHCTIYDHRSGQRPHRWV